MTVARRSAFGTLPLLISVAAGCSTSPGNTYGSGGTTGAVQVRDSLIGVKGDTSAFTISIGAQTKPVVQNGVVSFTDLTPGDYAVTIGALGKCTAGGGNTQATQVFAGYVQYLTFVTTCS